LQALFDLIVGFHATQPTSRLLAEFDCQFGRFRFDDRRALALFALDDESKAIWLILMKDPEAATSAVAACHRLNVC
jgi:hypothetical protein